MIVSNAGANLRVGPLPGQTHRSGPTSNIDMTTLTTNSALTATIQMNAGDQTGEQADWRNASTTTSS